MSAERLQKILAAAGHGSRRACETLIQAGRVRVNGQVARLGEKADPEKDRITLDGEPVLPEERRYVLLYKPRQVVSSLRAQGDRRTVRDLVPLPGRLFPVGRLDMESEGLVLMTNDGDLTNRLTHPRYGHEKEYHVLVAGRPDAKQLATWRRGVVLDGEWTAQARVTVLRSLPGETWLRVVMHEGRNHQIRRVAKSLGLGVKRLQRVRIGPLHIGELKPGEWRLLKPGEVTALRQHVEQKKPPQKRGKSGRRTGR